MKKLIFIWIISLILSNASFGQVINIPADSIATFLCKKWEMDYTMMGGMKIGKMPNAPDMSFEFNMDKTFLTTRSDSKENGKGTWNYDPKKKVIKMMVKGGSNLTIISLKEDELVMRPETKDAASSDLAEMKIFCKIKGN